MTDTTITLILKRARMWAACRFKKSRGNGTTGTKIHWKPDLEVFTDIDIGADYLADILRRQAVVNDGVELVLKNEHEDGTFTEQIFCYENGISDYLLELVGDKSMTTPQH